MMSLLLLVLVDRMVPTPQWCKPTRRCPTRGDTPRRRRRVSAVSKTTTKSRCVRNLPPIRYLVLPLHQLISFAASRTATVPVSADACAVMTDAASLASSPLRLHHVRSVPYTVSHSLIYVHWSAADANDHWYILHCVSTKKHPLLFSSICSRKRLIKFAKK